MKYFNLYKQTGFSFTLMYLFVLAHHVSAEIPDWTIISNDYQNTMSIVLTLSDECIPSDDPLDLVAAFDISGEIRGVQQTSNAGGIAFLSIYSNGGGETILFKVYDNSTDSVYNITHHTIVFQPNQNLGFPNPEELIFDSNSTAIGNAGPDQEVFNSTTTTLNASGAGTWLIREGSGGSVTDLSDPHSIFTGVIGTKYTLVWTQDDLENCIGEPDEVIIILVTDEPENNLAVCGDKLDNDGDGVYDCEDLNCGAPDFLIITDLILPSPLSCTTTLADGAFDITTNSFADQFSIDGGANYQSSNHFDGLIAGSYHLVILNSVTACSYSEMITIANTNDPDGDGMCESDNDSCATLNDEDFESGNGIWQSNGVNAELVMSTHSAAGDHSFRLRGNSGMASSISSPALDFSANPSAVISFSYQAVAMLPGDGFILEISNDGGSNFIVIQEWENGSDFDNDIVFDAELSFANNQISSTTIIRFRCDGTDNTNEIYIDDVKITSCQSDCDQSIIYVENDTINRSLDAGHGIETNGIIKSGSDLVYSAGEYILTNPGFEIEANATFHAYVSGCEE